VGSEQIACEAQQKKREGREREREREREKQSDGGKQRERERDVKVRKGEWRDGWGSGRETESLPPVVPSANTTL